MTTLEAFIVDEYSILWMAGTTMDSNLQVKDWHLYVLPSCVASYNKGDVIIVLYMLATAPVTMSYSMTGKIERLN